MVDSLCTMKQAGKSNLYQKLSYHIVFFTVSGFKHNKKIKVWYQGVIILFYRSFSDR